LALQLYPTTVPHTERNNAIQCIYMFQALKLKQKTVLLSLNIFHNRFKCVWGS